MARREQGTVEEGNDRAEEAWTRPNHQKSTLEGKTGEETREVNCQWSGDGEGGEWAWPVPSSDTVSFFLFFFCFFADLILSIEMLLSFCAEILRR